MHVVYIYISGTISIKHTDNLFLAGVAHINDDAISRLGLRNWRSMSVWRNIFFKRILDILFLHTQDIYNQYCVNYRSLHKHHWMQYCVHNQYYW